MAAEKRRDTALITGASGGIGEELADLCAAHGNDLVLVARSEDRLRKLADDLAGKHGIRVVVLPVDLADPAAPQRLCEELTAQGIEVDVLINNAGFGLQGPLAEMDVEAIIGMLQVNVAALTLLTRLLLPPMIRKGRGRVLNVASTAAYVPGYVPGPFMAEYYASKAYVLSLTEALANELQGTGVTATALCPGPTSTGFAERAGVAHANLFQSRVMAVEQVAREGFERMLRGHAVVIPGARNRWLARLSGVAPRSLLAKVVRNLNSPAK
jgi:short-subunit dehydrogenase